MNPEIQEEVLLMLFLLLNQREHPTPFLHAKISLFSDANTFPFREVLASRGEAGGRPGGGLLRGGVESVLGFREMKPG